MEFLLVFFVGLVAAVGLVVTPLVRRNGLNISRLFAGRPVPFVGLAVGARVFYPDRNSHLKVARVVGFRPDDRVFLHVGHPNHSHFSRPTSQLRRVGTA